MQDQSSARLFGPGLPSTGVDARLWLAGSVLEIQPAEGSPQRIAIDALRLREVVSAEAGIEVSWDSPAGTFAAHVAGAAAIKALRSHPSLQGSAQLSSLRAKQRRNRFGRALGWSAVALFVLLPLLLLAAFLWQADRIAGAIAGRVPVAEEQRLGRQVFSGMQRTLDLQRDGPEVQLVQELGARLTRGSRYQYQFHVARDDSINAFALPGGVIVVHTGLIDAAQRPEELAGVLAHEVQHVELRHSLEAMIRELGLRGLWAAVTGDLGATLAGQAAMQLTQLRFSREAEREADVRGFQALVREGIDPGGMVDFFGTMAGSESGSVPDWLSSHPASKARQEDLRAMQAALGGRIFQPLPPAAP